MADVEVTGERNPTNEQIEAEVSEHMRQLANLSEKDLREGYRHLLLLNGFLRRSLTEAVTLARPVFIGPKGYFDTPSTATPTS